MKTSFQNSHHNSQASGTLKQRTAKNLVTACTPENSRGKPVKNQGCPKPVPIYPDAYYMRHPEEQSEFVECFVVFFLVTIGSVIMWALAEKASLFMQWLLH